MKLTEKVISENPSLPLDEVWIRIAERIVTANDCKNLDTVRNWADAITEAYAERFPNHKESK